MLQPVITKLVSVQATVTCCILALWFAHYTLPIAWANSLAHIRSVQFKTSTVAAVPPTLVIDTHYQVRETVLNGQFAAGLESWQTQGSVKQPVVTDVAPSIIIGPTGELSENFVEQRLHFGETPPTHLSFTYRLLSQESLVGFDQPCFRVMGDEFILYEDDCQNLTDTTKVMGETYQASTWRTVRLDIREWSRASLKLRFLAGNTVDMVGASGVEIKWVSTTATELQSDSQVSFTPNQPVGYHWQGQDFYLPSGVPVSLALSGEGQLLRFWSVSAPQAIYQLPVAVSDAKPPSMVGVNVYPNADKSYTLEWESPGRGLRYEAKVAAEWQWFYTRDWHSLTSVTLETKYQDLWYCPLSLPPGTSEFFRVSPGHQGQFLQIKTRDAAGNYSIFSPIVELQ